MESREPRRPADARARRGRELRLLAGALLLSTALLGLLPGATAHPYHEQEANDPLLPLREPLHAQQWLAQSFIAEKDYHVSRVALLVEDVGISDLLHASIRTDDSGQPAATNLTEGAVDGPFTASWTDVDLSPFSPLAAGQTYWIVAHSQEPNGQGYDWFRSVSDSYENGTGVTSPEGSSWTLLDGDFAFRVSGYETPDLEVAVVVSETTLKADDTTVFRVHFNNTGTTTAEALWVNATFPPELGYVDDDADALGGVRTGTSWEFSDVAPGNYDFNVTVRAEGGTADGTEALTAFVFEAIDHAGAPPARHELAVPVSIRNALLDAAVTASPVQPDPGDPVTFRGTATNVGGDRATNLTLTGSVGPSVTFVSSNPEATYDDETRTVTWLVGELNIGVSAEVEWTVEIPPGTDDGTVVPAWFLVEYEDATGTPMPEANVSTDVGVQAPLFAPVLAVDPSEAQRFDEVAAYLHYNNTGSAPSPQAWANWTLNGHYELVGLVPDLPYLLTEEGFSVSLTDVAPGGHLLVAKLRVLPGGPDGLAMDLRVDWNATDGNGNLLPPAQTAATVTLGAPAFDPVLRLDRTTAQRGDLVQATLHYNNTGSAAAQWAWLNWSFAEHYELVALSEPLPSLATAEGIAVLDPEVEPGVHALTLTLRVVSGSPDGLDLPLRATLAPTDGKGVSLPEASRADLVRLRAPAFDPVLRLERATAEHDDAILARLYVNNTGSAAASRAWANWSLNGHYAFLSVEPAVAVEPLADGFSLALQDLAPGPHLLEVRLRVVRGMADRLPMPVTVRWAALDGNGLALEDVSRSGSVELLAPKVLVTAQGPGDPVAGGATFLVNVTLTNEGRTTATGVLRLVLPAGVEYRGDDGGVLPTEENRTLLWPLEALGPGTVHRLSVQLRVTDGSGTIGLRFAFLASDTRGSPSQTIPSNDVAVDLLPPDPSPLGSPWALLGIAAAAAAPAGLLLLWRRRSREVNVEEVFVIDRGGLLLAHRSHSLLSSLDEDILAAMLTAVQQFVADAFSRGLDESIKALDFGERTILVEARPYHYVAVVCRSPDAGLEDRLQTLADEIEAGFGPLLEDWDGDMDRVRGIHNLLPRLWSARAPRAHRD